MNQRIPRQKRRAKKPETLFVGMDETAPPRLQRMAKNKRTAYHLRMLTSTATRDLARPIDRQPDRNPVRAYIMGLTSETSRTTMRASLRSAVRIILDEQIGRETLAERTSRIEREDERIEAFQWEALTPGIAPAIRAVLVGRMSPASANKALIAIRGVVKTCWRMNLMTTDQRERVIDCLKPIKAQDDEPAGRYLGYGERARLFEVCAEDPTPRGRRDALILALLSSGLRRSEVCALNRGDIDTQTGRLRIKQAKGGRTRTIYLDDQALAALSEWLAVRGDERGALVLPVTSSGVPIHRKRKRATAEQMAESEREDRPTYAARLSPNTILARVEKLAEVAKIDNMTPHDWRRTCASDLLDAGRDLASVQAHLGHASPTTTARYDRRGERARRETGRAIRTPFRASRTGSI